MPTIIRPSQIGASPLIRRTFFFVGPVSGGGDWQARGFELLMELAIKRKFEDFQAMIPVPEIRKKDDAGLKYDYQHPLSGFFGGTPRLLDILPRQLDWERYGIKCAAGKDIPEDQRYGCVVIWCGKESHDNPRKDGPYARDTLGEVGRLSVLAAEDPRLNIVFGIDPEFPGADVMTRNIIADHTDEGHAPCPIYRTLETTIQAAAEKALRNRLP